MGWMRAGGMVVALLLLAACGGTPSQLESGGSLVGNNVETGIQVAPIAGAATLDQEGEPTPLSDAELIEMGGMLYMSNCAPCHQVNGEGTLSTFPALNRNPFVTVADPTGVIDVVLHGQQIMPAFERTLTAQDVAAVVSYIRNAWDNQAPVVSEAQVREVQSQSEVAGE
jgi:mono/diheme cytochrome c family protein